MIVDELSREFAALVSVASLAMIGIAFALLRPYWDRFEEHRKRLSRSVWKPTSRVSVTVVVWLTLVMLVYGGLSIRGSHYVPAIWIPLTFGSFALMIFVFVIDFGIRRKIKKQIVIDPDINTARYFIALLSMGSSVFLNIVALLGVAPAMLSITFGPIDYGSFVWARWFMASAIQNFCFGIVFFGIAFFEDKIEQWKSNLREDNQK